MYMVLTSPPSEKKSKIPSWEAIICSPPPICEAQSGDEKGKTFYVNIDINKISLFTPHDMHSVPFPI